MSASTESTPAPAESMKVTRTRGRRGSSLLSQGEPMLWLTAGVLALCLFMVIGLLALVFYQGLTTFWPQPLQRVELTNGEYLMGEVSRREVFAPGPELLATLAEELSAEQLEAIEQQLVQNDGESERRMLRTGNFELTNTHFHWVSDYLIEQEDYPEWALLFEVEEGGRYYGFPAYLHVDGEAVASEPEAIWTRFQELHSESRDRRAQIAELRKFDIGRTMRKRESARLDARQVELDHGADTDEYWQAFQAFRRVANETDVEAERIGGEILELERENDRYQLGLLTAQGEALEFEIGDIVRTFPANQLGFGEKLSIYFDRWGEYLSAEPREANSEGGVYPAIFGTVVMTLIMAILVVPFGILAALYLREYAKAGPMVSVVRIAVNNLAGVPSIVFGVFGLGFFCYFLGGTIDEVFFEAKLPSPTFGQGGVLWASLTLALLTLPVVIVSTEESLAAVPSSMREGSYACGASKWQTIRRIILPRAMPGILTGMILAMARGAGEVAPLMLVGAVKLAPDLAVDGVFPYVHPERSFMHLGFHIYDQGFQSQNSEAARPMVYTTTLLLIGIIVALNVFAIWVRARLRRRFTTTQI